MARIKTSRDFPEYFHQLFATSLETNVEFVADTEQEAISLQHQLHRFRRVCEQENLAIARKYREVTVSRSGAQITLRNPANKIREALARAGASEKSPVDLDEYIRQSETKHEPLGETDERSQEQQTGYEPFFRPIDPRVNGTREKEKSEKEKEKDS